MCLFTCRFACQLRVGSAWPLVRSVLSPGVSPPDVQRIEFWWWQRVGILTLALAISCAIFRRSLAPEPLLAWLVHQRTHWVGSMCLNVPLSFGSVACVSTYPIWVGRLCLNVPPFGSVVGASTYLVGAGGADRSLSRIRQCQRSLNRKYTAKLHIMCK